MQMIAHIIRIAGLHMHTVHRIIKVADELLGRHTTSCSGFTPLFPQEARAHVPASPTDARCTRVYPALPGRGAAHPDLDAERFTAWIAQRHAQVEQGTLVYIAHQLDNEVEEI